MAYKAIDIAKKLIKVANLQSADGSDCMTNLRLQKMLYYEQGYHLAMCDTPLFVEDIEAWMYGPVVPSVYEHYRNFGSQILETEPDDLEMTDEENKLLVNVFESYKEFSTFGLMKQTHKESPWKTIKSIGRGSVISKESMKSYFKTQLIDEED
jgi:uncharacterized phage-associated protein